MHFIAPLRNPLDLVWNRERSAPVMLRILKAIMLCGKRSENLLFHAIWMGLPQSCKQDEMTTASGSRLADLQRWVLLVEDKGGEKSIVGEGEACSE